MHAKGRRVHNKFKIRRLGRQRHYKKMQDAHVDIIECGWLKDKAHEVGSVFYHVPADLEQYLLKKSLSATYVVMIDWDRYNTDNLPPV